MKKKYFSPEFVILKLDSEDICNNVSQPITGGGQGGGGGNNEGPEHGFPDWD